MSTYKTKQKKDITLTKPEKGRVGGHKSHRIAGYTAGFY